MSEEYRVWKDLVDGTVLKNFEEPFYDVSIIGSNEPIGEGETLEVDYSVTNTGDETGEQDIRLEIDSDQVDVDQDVLLEGDDTTTDILEWMSGEGSAGDYPATVLSDDDSDTITVTVESDIPDSDVYLHDDWGDNKLTDRDGSTETTHNGEEGIYRPEWDTMTNLSSPTAQSERLDSSGNEGVRTGINLNLDETITWEWTDVDITGGGTSAPDYANLHCFAESTHDDRDGRMRESYVLNLVHDDSVVRLQRVDADEATTTLIDFDNIDSVVDIEVTRSPSGEWEVIIDGSSQGTATDTTFTDPQYIGISTNDGGDLKLDEVKVF